MYSSQKIRLLEKAYIEGALSMDFALEIYSHRSSASRAIKDLDTENGEGLLKEVQPPPVSQYNKLWILTDKGETILDY